MKGVIQVGAYRGEDYQAWANIGIKHFLFFEPIPENFIQLIKRLPTSKNIHAFQIALGDKTGQIEMLLSSNKGQSGSIMEPQEHLKQFPDVLFNSKIVVNIDRLDNIKYDRKLYDYLKVAAQGYELEVFKGAKESLQFITKIDCQVYRTELYKGCPMIEDIAEYLMIYEFHLIKVTWNHPSWGYATFQKRGFYDC